MCGVPAVFVQLLLERPVQVHPPDLGIGPNKTNICKKQCCGSNAKYIDLDPDPGFWPNLNPYHDHVNNFEEEKILKKISFKNNKKIMRLKQIFSQLGLCMVKFCTLHFLPLIYSIFTCVDPIWIWIHNTGKNYGIIL